MCHIYEIYRVSGLDKMQELCDLVNGCTEEEIDVVGYWVEKNGLKADVYEDVDGLYDKISVACEKLGDDPYADACYFGVWSSLSTFKESIEFDLADVVVKYPALTQPEDYYVAVIWN